MNNITIVNYYNGDWAGLYVNEKFVFGNHSIKTHDYKDYTPIGSIQKIEIDFYPKCCEYLDNYGNFPTDLTLSEFISIEEEKKK